MLDAGDFILQRLGDDIEMMKTSFVKTLQSKLTEKKQKKPVKLHFDPNKCYNCGGGMNFIACYNLLKEDVECRVMYCESCFRRKSWDFDAYMRKPWICPICLEEVLSNDYILY